MADKIESSWEPGTLDNTRRNIGPIDENEAKKMMKKLGGEILQEKSAPIDYSAFPRAKEFSKRAVGKSASTVSASTAAAKIAAGGAKAGNKVGFATVEKKAKPNLILPELTSKERSLMDRIMMSEDYKIKTNLGLFNFMRRFKKNGAELVRKGFVEYDLQKDIEHLQEFITAVKSLIQICPDTYKTKIISANEDKFRFLKTVGSWTMKDIKLLALNLKDNADETTVVMLIPIIKTIYRNLIKIYYLGENRISNFFKEIYGDLIKYPKFDQKKALVLAKSAMNEWFFIYSHVIRGLYPLLMRMCSSKFDYFQDFFMGQSTNILNFLELTKFDLLLPNKKAEKRSEEKKEEEQKKIEEDKKAEEQKTAEKNKDMEIVEAGLKLLDNLFPDAGFLHLDTMPDMYPYFQPLYQFRDGYNLLSPYNPLQITVTLLRITEDFFQGCRNIVFTEENEEEDTKIKDQLSLVLSEWSVYREDLFEKQYGDQIRDFVNSEYSQGDFKSSLFGKKMITTMLWQTKYNFLPHFEFEQLLLEKPKNDSQYRPLCIRTEFMYRLFLNFSKNIDAAAKTKDSVLGIKNPWERYTFDIPNVISKRLDVLLGAKRMTDTAATNANLIKYSLGAIAVLNWWVNDKASPAYSTDSTKIYRVNETDGGPAFSQPLRSDQNKLFADRVKKNIERQKAAANEQQ